MSNDYALFFRKELARFRKILQDRGYFWDINQLHVYYKYDEHLSAHQVKEYWEKFISISKTNKIVSTNVDFYIHIPFCSSKCSYCLFPSWELKNKVQLERYIEYLCGEMEYFAPVFRNVKFRNLYLGGGTPSVLTGSQLRRLLTSLFNNFSFSDNGQRTSESNPHTTKNINFGILRKFGFNRVSLGVQSLNKSALKLNKRDYQEYDKIKSAIILAKKSGFQDINIDLIVGLAGDSLDHFRRNFVEMLKLKPYNIVVYGLMPPSAYYLTELLKMDRKEYFFDYYPRMITAALEIMKKESTRCGYVADSFDSARWHWGFRLREMQYSNPSETYSGEYAGCTFGLGIFSRSHIHNMLEYKQTVDLDNFDPHAKIFEGIKLNIQGEMVKFIINQLDRESRISMSLFEQMFGRSILDAFPYALGVLKLLKRIKINSISVEFISRKPQDKYIYVQFFLVEAGLLK